MRAYLQEQQEQKQKEAVSTIEDRVKMWLTFNEAWTFTWLGSGAGKAPSLARYPMGSDAKWPLIAGHNVLLAHGMAVQRYRKLFQAAQGGKIGITNNCDWREPIDADPLNVGAAARAVEFWLGWMADPILSRSNRSSPRASRSSLTNRWQDR